MSTCWHVTAQSRLDVAGLKGDLEQAFGKEGVVDIVGRIAY